jgi:Tol biopolymer transport system component
LRRTNLRPALAAIAFAAIVAAAFTSPGRAVVDRVRDAIGVDGAEQTLFSLPAPGRLLVASDGGAWVVAADGGKRRLGDYDEASWSPFGRFVVATRHDEIAALDPSGETQWKLARPRARFARWGGSRTDTRIAYLSGRELRVVAGDGEGDRRFAASVAAVAPAWRPLALHVLAYAADGRVIVADAASRRRLWSRRVADVRGIEWSRDGTRLLVRGQRSLRVFRANGSVEFELLREVDDGAPLTAAAFSPSGLSVAFVARTVSRSHVWLIPRLRPDASAAREVFSGPGAFTDLAWSPDGRWVLAAWRDADQWLFLSSGERRQVRAVANVRRQFESERFPRIGGWVAP